MNHPPPRVVPLGEAAFTVVLGSAVSRGLHRQVLALAARIAAAEIPGVIELIPAFAVLTVRFDPQGIPAPHLQSRLDDLATVPLGSEEETLESPGPLFSFPVRYDGPDLAEVSRATGLSPESVVRMHSEREYVVYMLGFAPGWAYLGDLHPALVIPRRSAPRTRVPPGSVAIGGAQTGVYPLATPGGWHLIGSTEVKLFDPERNPPALLSPGDRVRFEPLA